MIQHTQSSQSHESPANPAAKTSWLGDHRCQPCCSRVAQGSGDEASIGSRSWIGRWCTAMLVGCWFLAFSGGMARSVSAQGFLVNEEHAIRLSRRLPPANSQRPGLPGAPGLPAQPVRDGTYELKELAVEGTIRDQVASIQLTQVFSNPGSRVLEAQFVFPVPPDATIHQLTLLVDGQEFPAKLLPADEARSIYEAIVRTSRDPALLEYVGYGLLKTSVFPIPAGAKRTVVLKYEQILPRSANATQLLVPLSTAQYTARPLDQFRLQLELITTVDQKTVYSPTHGINVQRIDARHSRITLPAGQQPGQDLRLIYDVDASAIGTSLLSYRPRAGEDGYFLLLASPAWQLAETARAPKTVVLTIDKSGSMAGPKFKQARAAAEQVLQTLTAGDTFHLVAYDSEVTSFRPELEPVTPETLAAAVSFLQGLYPGGGTNIAGALAASLKPLQDPDRPTYVLFLTDGLPTVGEQQEGPLAELARQANRVRARLITFGVGYDVHTRLLDRLASDHGGFSEYVRPNESIETAVGQVANRIAAPLLTQLELDFQASRPLAFRDSVDQDFAISCAPFVDRSRKQSQEEVSEQPAAPINVQLVSATIEPVVAPPLVNRLLPTKLPDLFRDQQMVIVGRYRESGPVRVTLRGRMLGEMREFTGDQQLAGPDAGSGNSFIARLWARRRVAQIIEQLDQYGRNPELIQELTQLALEHGILTPYTSFLADDTPGVRTLASDRLSLATEDRLSDLAQVTGRRAVSQRSRNQALAGEKSLAPSGPADSIDSLSAAGGLSSPQSIDPETDESAPAKSIRQNSSLTLYKRGRYWIANSAADVDLEKDAKQIITIERFSEPYFALARENSREENQLLASLDEGDELLIRLRGQLYRVK